MLFHMFWMIYFYRILKQFDWKPVKQLFLHSKIQSKYKILHLQQLCIVHAYLIYFEHQILVFVFLKLMTEITVQHLIQ